MIAYHFGRSHAWNAAHPPKLPARPRKLPAAPVTLFGHPIEGPIGIGAGPLPNGRWVLAYARLGYGLLTYRTVRTVERAAFPAPNLAHCRLGDPCVVEPPPRRPAPGGATWAVSFGLPSPPPEVWRADVRRTRDRLAPTQLLSVSVTGTPVPGGDTEQLARDYARCAEWAAEAGADVVEVVLSGPDAGADGPRMLFEDPERCALVLARVRRAVGRHPVIAKLGAFSGPRPLHDVASRVAPLVDGFVLVDGLQRRVVKADGSAAFGPTRLVAGISGGAVLDHCRLQVEELLAWRKAGAWDIAVLAGGGITTGARARAALEAGADLALVATAALTEPLLAARFRQEAARPRTSRLAAPARVT